MSDQPQSLAAALAELQQHLPRIGKNAQGQRSRYADLAEITRVLLPLLAERGFSFTCSPTLVTASSSPQFVLRYALRWSGSDEKVMGDYPLPSSTSQTMGGAITYARRYCLLAVTGAAPDDDDDDAQAAELAIRAQRDMPPEVREDGSATDAELERMRTGSEPGTWRATSTAENDPFYDQPPGEPGEPLAPAEDQPGTINRRQLSMMHAKFIALGIADRDARLRWTEIAVGRPVASATELSFSEAGMLLAALTEEARERSKAGADSR